VSKEQKKKDIINRLKTIKGHISGIENMIEDDKSCDEVLLQIAAVKSSIQKVGLIVMEDHAMECLMPTDNSTSVSKEQMEKVIKTFVNFSK
jgi:CsoR family transcriptional regulator, copper-sensing transcriptional repressor